MAELHAAHFLAFASGNSSACLGTTHTWCVWVYTPSQQLHTYNGTV